MALHTGDVSRTKGTYQGLHLNQAARLLIAGHGGQILCSEATAGLLHRDLQPGIRVVDLGIYRLRDLPTPERLFQIEYSEMPERAFPRLNADAGHAANLPLQFTRFFGRETELRRLTGLLQLSQTRLVTLTGVGGMGKTRLAIEAATRLVEAFSGAVWFVPLADVSQARLIPSALFEALRLPYSGTIEPLEQAVDALRRQPSLLVLDNFEHLVEEGTDLVRTLLQRTPTLTCLITTRQRLELTCEHEFPVLPLPTPSRAGTQEQLSLYESVQLFVDRAQTVKPDFQITNGNAAAIADLCARLEGIPLAIELAASRAQILTPVQMLSQLANRCEFLVS